jgi:hypothetical protein
MVTSRVRVEGAIGKEMVGLENAAEHALTAFFWWRQDLPRAVADDYWRDVHGVLTPRRSLARHIRPGL